MAKKHAERFVELVEEALESVDEISCDRALRESVDGSAILIDVREESEWVRGHIPGAIHIGKGVIERDIEHYVDDPASRLILYCGGGYRSALAAENLQRMGYTDVLSMAGGYRGYTEQKKEGNA